MFAVVFEVLPAQDRYQQYLDIAAALRPRLDDIDGFLSIERFSCITDPGWILSLSLWQHEAALVQWRQHGEHRAAQAAGRASVFDDYRLRVVRLIDAIETPPPAVPMLALHEFPPAEQVAPGRRFKSLAAPGKYIDLQDVPAAFVNSRPVVHAPERLFCCEVLRHYGLFDRAQAPQAYPPVIRERQ